VLADTGPTIELRRLDDALIVWGPDDTLRTVNADLPGPPLEVGEWRNGDPRPVRERLD